MRRIIIPSLIAAVSIVLLAAGPTPIPVVEGADHGFADISADTISSGPITSAGLDAGYLAAREMEAGQLEVGSTRITPEGGVAVLLRNKTGAASVQGMIVRASNANGLSVDRATRGQADPFGAFYESGVPDDELAWVVVAGLADLLLEPDGGGSYKRGWVSVSSTRSGTVRVSAAPPTTPGSWADVQAHMLECGHSLQQRDGGELFRAAVHFN